MEFKGAEKTTLNTSTKKIQILQILKTHGFHQVLMVNHTKPELNIPVVQIFIPGMHSHSAH